MARGMVKFIWMVLDYFLTPVLMIGACLPLGLWWARDNPREWLTVAVFFLFLAGAIAYDDGYKKRYRYGRKKYFYIVFIVPICLALLGFIYGFLVVKL